MAHTGGVSYSHESYEIIDSMNDVKLEQTGLVRSLINDPAIDTSFFAVNVDDIVYKVHLWKKLLPRVTPYYAVKCNPTPVLLELLAGLGLGFDCASKAEIEEISRVLPSNELNSRIIYAHPCKTKSFIIYAKVVGVKMMTFDNEKELLKIKDVYPEAQLVIRIRVDDSGATVAFGEKFGAFVPDAEHLLRFAKELNLNIIGVSFHVGTGCNKPESFHDAIKEARKIFDMGRKFGFNMNLLDIGGGFPGTNNFEKMFYRISSVINDSIDEFFSQDKSVKIIAEPGRFIVASAFTLFANVIAKREQNDRNMYYLSDGVYGSFNCIVWDHYTVKPIVLDSQKNNSIKKSVIWGPTCDSLDKICDEIDLPELEIGSWLLFENMGAYTICAASLFNGFEKPELKFILSSTTAVYLQQFSFWESLVQHFGERFKESRRSSFSCATQMANTYRKTQHSYSFNMHA